MARQDGVLFSVPTGTTSAWMRSRRLRTINLSRYCDTLIKFKSSIRSQKPGLLSRRVLFLDDKARRHKARNMKEHIFHLGWERLDHSAYRPNLAPSDFYLFPELKSALTERHGAKRCGSCEELPSLAGIFTRIIS
ncbi:hypothetical protein AVEN_261082-1 [Araneus ventricosus]|uniref:Tc1-like transposase DDE domain-containing protein n=1 Tax=Araneus ventricosus TaxID=182803 RepID=A0A4Y2L320_ARAVE|nr:hypothetical protein AVEN_261082-1 [Araneus ventricosus]